MWSTAAAQKYDGDIGVNKRVIFTLDPSTGRREVVGEWFYNDTDLSLCDCPDDQGTRRSINDVHTEWESGVESLPNFVDTQYLGRLHEMKKKGEAGMVKKFADVIYGWTIRCQLRAVSRRGRPPEAGPLSADDRALRGHPRDQLHDRPVRQGAAEHQPGRGPFRYDVPSRLG